MGSGLRPDSDVDLLLLTRRSLADPERAALVALLLEVSGWSGHRERFPEVAHRRPLELTGLTVDAATSPDDPPVRDVQFGEWLREDLARGRLPLPEVDPDVVTLLTLSRMLVTLETGRIVAKDVAADLVAPTLTGSEREMLERARDGYRGIAPDDWTGLEPPVTALVHELAARARRLGALPAR